MTMFPTTSQTSPTRGYLLRCGNDEFIDLKRHRELGGHVALRKALAMTPDAVREQVKAANLRGRGGAGFPAGTKWGFLPKDNPKPRYLVINADEGEPGTFKDRYFLDQDPHALLEGVIITAWAIGAHQVYIYVRGEFFRPIERLESAIKELYDAGVIGKTVMGKPFNLDIVVHQGAGAYICGEESALLESIEGKPGRPRMKPPFPAVVGLFGCPTIINNVETMAGVRLILEHGADAFLAMGLPKDGGPKVFGLSGHVKRPGLYEGPMGLSLKKLIFEYGGGTIDDKPIKGVIPGGSSTAVLLPDQLDITMDFEGVKAAGSSLGTASVMVFTEGTCPVAVLLRIARFYAHESCGQCTPCRDGTGWLERIVESIEFGHGRPGDCDLLISAANQIMGNTICALGDAAAIPVISFVQQFSQDFEDHIRLGACPYGNKPEGH
ncbi:MAG TPA: NADH-quinone oxidoreductase subunit NuoF [Myxococcota bacterium]|nr:NADH-quinone oxidoreductase subunit NuoF [Myxococcota bacterium]HON25450.1 NADH-quinone oxidoreductase subunit NuoF [Myxococcota bacterium]HPC92446.1 NADH-quinone oxidoreductase subunit NuoF [Myxococcota bacterium]HQE73837.1 NADH-quinone oxidoreductase subunit NuoF [Myxococcota bacterium]HQI62244.1 NADH-quinone oxidoreductase subunit NuoF [Myxococcota bacterium]